MTASRSAWFWWAALALFAAAWAWACVTLPERVPLHFGVGGEVDRWGSRTTFLVLTGVVALGVAALLGLVPVGRLPLAALNMPHRDWWLATPERAERARTLVREDLERLGAATIALLAALVLLTVRAAELDPPRLDAWFAVAVGAYLVGVLGYTGYCYRCRYRPRPVPAGDG